MLCVIQARYVDEEEWTCVTAADTPERAHQLVGAGTISYIAHDRELPQFRIVGVEITEILWEEAAAKP